MKVEEIGFNDFLSMFQKDREKAISQIYGTYRSAFMFFARKYTNDEDLIIDAFQEAVIAFYQNATNGNITDVGSTIKTYLFSIGKFKLFSLLKKEAKYIPIENEVILDTKKQESIEIPEEIINAYDLLGETCKRIIVLFYYKRYSIDAIMNSMDFKNENTVKANKSRCIKQMRQLISEQSKNGK